MEKDKNRKLSRSEKEKTIENESNDQIRITTIIPLVVKIDNSSR